MSSNEFLQTHEELWTHTFSFINPMCIKCAVELGIFDAVHHNGGRITLPELIRAISIPPSKCFHLRRLMRKMTTSGYLTKQTLPESESEDTYLLTPLSRLLVEDNGRTGLAQFLIAMLHPTCVEAFSYMSVWFKEDKPPTEPTPFAMAHGCDFWAMLGRNADVARVFNEGMASDTGFAIDVLVRDHGEIFRGVKSLVDVGGGVGASTRVIAAAFPEVKCTVLDLPQVIGEMKGDGNVEFVAGNVFERVPPANTVFLKWFLHDWGDEDCIKILRRCKEAIPSKEEGGKVIIIEMVMGYDVNSEELEQWWDLGMAVMAGSHERDEQEWKKIFLEAGYSNYKIIPFLKLRPVIEVYP